MRMRRCPACAVITFLPTGQSGFSASADGWGTATPRVLHYLVILPRLDKIHPTVPKYLTGWQNWSLFRSYNILGYFQLVKFILCVSAEGFHMMTYHFLFEFNSKYENGTCVAHHRVIFDPRALLPLRQRAECGRNH